MHELYYTSAPHGLRSHSSGFCTVATTGNFPRPLIDRLEALSAYRHHSPAPGSNASDSPVSHAHWIVRLAGREHHVLSRICDSGLDYTQRTNFFAHHLLLEPHELHPAGPAWMIAQPGVMQTQWDGQVGTIVRKSPLPSGGERFPSAGQQRPCTAWEAAAGDAGWAGALAESFVRNPARLAFIYYHQNQLLLPLIAEAIGLLPAELRWNVTFNTYFTSLPNSATCAWRCCLAASPAAAPAPPNGALVIDLARPGQIPPPPDAPYVHQARTGQALAPAGAPVPVHFATRPPPRRRLGEKPPPPSVPREAELYDLAPDQPPVPSAPTTIRLAPDAHRPTPAAHRRSLQKPRRTGRLAAIYLAAILALAAGTWLLSRAYQPPPADLPPPAQAAAPTAPITEPPDLDATGPQPRFPPDVQPEPTSRDHPEASPAQPPVTGSAMPGSATPAHSSAHPPSPPPPPRNILLDARLRPTPGAGLQDPVQTIPIPPDQWDARHAVANLAFQFPNERDEYVLNLADITGTLTARHSPLGADPLTVSILYQPRGRPASREVMRATVDPNASTLQVTWRANMILSQPHITNLTALLAQGASFIVSDAENDRPQAIRLRPIEFPVRLADHATPLPLNIALPPGCLPLVVSQLPEPWEVQYSQDSAPAPSPGNPAEGRTQGQAAGGPSRPTVRLFQRTGEGEIAADFTLAFDLTPGAAAAQPQPVVYSNLAQRRREDRTQLEAFQRDLDTHEQELRRLLEQADAEIRIYQEDLDRLRQPLRSPDDQALQHPVTPEGRQFEMERLDRLIDQRRQRFEHDSRPAREAADMARRLVRRYHHAVTAYARPPEIDVAIVLPDGTRLLTLNYRN